MCAVLHYSSLVIQQFYIISACAGIKGRRLIRKRLGDNYKEGTSPRTGMSKEQWVQVGPPLLICWQQDSSVCHVRLKRKELRGKKQSEEFIESCHGCSLDAGRHWPLTDLFSCSIVCRESSRGWGRLGEEGRHGPIKKEGFRDYSPWAENQSRWSEVGVIWVVLWWGCGNGTVFNKRHSVTLLQFKSSRRNCMCQALSFPSSPCLDNRLSLPIYTLYGATAVSTCPGRWKCDHSIGNAIRAEI